DQVLALLGPGDSYAEGTLLDEYPHSTSACVTEPVEAIEFPRETILRISRERPALYARLAVAAAQIIAMRLRAANARLAGREQIYLPGELRREKDLLGEREVPDREYYGIQTLRAIENFPITGITIAQYPNLIVALAAIKEAAARANQELGLLDAPVADAIAAACQEIRGGALHSEFVVDVIQGGAGTSTNMNANEVIATRAPDILGPRRGGHRVLPPSRPRNLPPSTTAAS